MAERNIIVSDVLYVLKLGFVLMQPGAAPTPGVYRYAIDNRTPNSDSRDIRVVAIPDETKFTVKAVTVMWADELATRAGSIIG
jgi:hypothetical protein